MAQWELRTTVPYGDWFALTSAGTLSGGSPRCNGAYASGSSQGAEVTLTDPGLPTRFSKGADSISTLEFLRRNVALNDAPTARAEKLLWGDADDLEAFRGTPPFDLVVASEVLYEPSQYAALADTLAFFATDAIIGYKVRHGREQTFFDRCADEHGFRVSSEPLAGEKLSKDAVLATLRRPQ